MEVENRENGGGEPSMVPRSATLHPPLPPLLPPPPRITYRPLDARSLPDLRALNSALFPISYGPRVYEQALASGGISHGAFFDGEELVGAITVRLEAGTAASVTAAPAASLFVGEGGGGGGGAEEEGNGDSLDGGLARMYVMTVGVLSSWRGKGIGEFFFFFFESGFGERRAREEEGLRCRCRARVFSLALTFHVSLPKQNPNLSLLSPLTGTTLLANALSMAAADGGVGVAYLHAHVANAEALAFYRDKLGFRRGATARGYYRRLSPPDAVVLWRRLR